MLPGPALALLGLGALLAAVLWSAGGVPEEVARGGGTGAREGRPEAVAFTTGGPWRSLTWMARTDSGVVVIDLGWLGPEDRIREGLETLGATPSDVAAVLLTHTHRDHIGGWELFPEARFVVAAPAVPRLTGERGHHDLGSRAAEWLRGTETPTPGELRVVAFERDTALVFGSDTVRAFPLPGHTPGSAAYLHRGVLFVGDAVSWLPLDGLTGPRRIYTWDRERNRRSLARLREAVAASDVRWICTAHARCARPDPELWEELAG